MKKDILHNCKKKFSEILKNNLPDFSGNSQHLMDHPMTAGYPPVILKILIIKPQLPK
jgi:hypothetical protein